MTTTYDINGAPINSPIKGWTDEIISPPITSSALIFLAEISAYHNATNSLHTLRYCSGSGYFDTDGNFYEPRIEQPALMRRDIFSEGKIGGVSQVGYGELTLINADGELDGLSDYAIDGREIFIKVGNAHDDYYRFVTVLKATMAQMAFEWHRVSIRLRDRQAEFNVPLQSVSYAGTNVLPAGREGGAT